MNLNDGIFVATFIAMFVTAIVLIIWAIGKHDQ